MEAHADERFARALALCAEVLGVAGVEPGHNLIDLGGDSLAAIELTDRLHEELGVSVRLEDLFDTSLGEAFGRALP